MAVHRAGASLNVNVDLTATVRSWHNLVQHHLWNAQHAARLCRDREDDLTALDYRRPDVELNGTAMVAVSSSVAFLEALVNEVYLDAADPLLRSRVYSTASATTPSRRWPTGGTRSRQSRSRRSSLNSRLRSNVVERQWI